MLIEVSMTFFEWKPCKFIIFFYAGLEGAWYEIQSSMCTHLVSAVTAMIRYTNEIFWLIKRLANWS